MHKALTLKILIYFVVIKAFSVHDSLYITFESLNYNILPREKEYFELRYLRDFIVFITHMLIISKIIDDRCIRCRCFGNFFTGLLGKFLQINAMIKFHVFT